MRRLFASVACLVLAVTSRASTQQPAPTFRVDVRPSVELRAGNVVRVSYTLRWNSTAADSLNDFTVRSPVPVTRVTAPAAIAGGMLLGTSEGDSPAAGWSFLVAMPRNGQSVGPLTYDAVGLPGIVQYRAMRHVPVREAGPGDLTDEPPALQFDVASADQVIGATLGVVKPPANQTPAGLASWLREQIAQACALGWLGAVANCDRVLAVFDSGGLPALLGELNRQRGNGVNETAYVVLSAAAAGVAARAGH